MDAESSCPSPRPGEYARFLASIKERILGARLRAAASLNEAMLRLYWEIGKALAERKERSGWGDAVIERLSRDLRREFPGLKGLSRTNLCYMRQWYLAYRGKGRICPAAAGQIPWLHNILIINKIKPREQRLWYARKTLELGVGFAFLGRQYRLEVGSRDYYIDLLFYHMRLRSLIAFDLKTEEFQPEDAGKMNFYLSALDDLVRPPEGRPSIGIILCKTKDRTTVDYSLRDTAKPIGVSAYRLTSSLPEELRGALPPPEVLEQGLGDPGRRPS